MHGQNHIKFSSPTVLCEKLPISEALLLLFEG